MKLAICLLFGVLLNGALKAQVLFFDSADQPAYADGLQAGDNGGWGLRPWEDESFWFGDFAGSLFVGSATGNGGSNPQTIDTSGVSWGIEPLFILNRLFGYLSLGVHDTLSVAADGGGAVVLFTDGSPVGVGIGSGGSYTLSDPNGPIFDFGIPANGDGVVVQFMIQEPGEIRVSVTPLGGLEIATEQSFSGTIIYGIELETFGSTAYFNSLQAFRAIPEPDRLAWASTVALTLFVLLCKRRRLIAP